MGMVAAFFLLNIAENTLFLAFCLCVKTHCGVDADIHPAGARRIRRNINDINQAAFSASSSAAASAAADASAAITAFERVACSHSATSRLNTSGCSTIGQWPVLNASTLQPSFIKPRSHCGEWNMNGFLLP